MIFVMALAAMACCPLAFTGPKRHRWLKIAVGFFVLLALGSMGRH